MNIHRRQNSLQEIQSDTTPTGSSILRDRESDSSPQLIPVVEKESEPSCAREPEQAAQVAQENAEQHFDEKFTPGHYGVLIGAFCGLFASFGWRSGSGFFQAYYAHDQLRDESSSAISWINSIGFFLMYFGACFVGPITHRTGPQPLLLLGSALHIAGLLGASWCARLYQFILTQGIISSLGASAVFFISVQTLGRWFELHQAFAMGISASGVSAGGVIFPLMVRHLITSIGFAWTMRAVVLVLLILMIVSNLTLRRPPAWKREQRQLRVAAPEGESRWAGLGDWRFILTILGTSLFSNGYFVVLTFLVTVSEIRGWKGDPANSLVILNGASFFGRIIPGMVADRAGSFNTMLVLGIISTILILALWLPDTAYPGSIVFSVLFGFTSASTVSLGPAMVFRVSKERYVTRDLAVLYLVQSVAGLTSSPIGGALLDAAHNRDPLYLQIFCGLMTGLGTVLILLARNGLTGNVLWSKV